MTTERTNDYTSSQSLRTTELEIKTTEADIANLASLLSQGSVDIGEDDDPDVDDADVAKLLRRLENANGMAQGVEERLDGLLEKLDSLMASLEAEHEAESQKLPMDKSAQ